MSWQACKKTNFCVQTSKIIKRKYLPSKLMLQDKSLIKNWLKSLFMFALYYFQPNQRRFRKNNNSLDRTYYLVDI